MRRALLAGLFVAATLTGWSHAQPAPAQPQMVRSAGVIHEPTTKDNPNVVPGQRIPINFYAQSALYDPGVTYRSAKEYLDLISQSFFASGEAKVPKP